MAVVTICSDFGAPQNKVCHCFHCFPIYLPWNNGTRSWSELVFKESWAPKNRCFWTMVLEKTLESPLNSKEIKQSILKEVSPEYSLEGLILKLKLQYFGHLMWRARSLGKTLMLGKMRAGEGGVRRWDGWMTSLTQWTWVWANFKRSRRIGKPGVQSTGSQTQAQLGNWTTTKLPLPYLVPDHCCVFSA